MSIDPLATPKDFSLILYTKTEIDALHLAETTRVNDLLDLKSLKSDEGAPSGISTLDASGKVNPIELPISTIAESDDNTNNVTVISPERLHYQLDLLFGKHTYDYVSVSNVVVTNDIYEEVARLITPSRPGGAYEEKLSMLWTLDNKNASAFFRYSQDGGTTWIEVILEPGASSNIIPETLLFPHTHIDGASMDLVVQARKENALDVLTIHSMSLIFESKVLD